MRISFVVLLLALTAGCSITWPPWQHEPGALASSGTVVEGAHLRPSVSSHGNKVWVSTETPGMKAIWLHEWNGSRWDSKEIAKSGGNVDASRVYGPSVVFDKSGAGYVAFRCGVKEWGTQHGPAVYTASGGLKFLGFTIGAARMALDSEGQAVIMSKNGAWARVGQDGGIEKQGFYGAAGSTGEKFDFATKGSRWAVAMNGYAAMSSSVGVGTEAGGQRTVWADCDTYPDQGNDLCYPGTGFRGSNVFMCSVYGGRLRANELQGGQLSHSVTNLRDLGSAVMEDRMAPGVVALGDKLYVVFTQGGKVKLCDVETGNLDTVASGSMPSACAYGDQLLIVYVSGNKVAYKLVTP